MRRGSWSRGFCSIGGPRWRGSARWLCSPPRCSRSFTSAPRREAATLRPRSGTGRRQGLGQVVQLGAADRGGREVALHPRGDLAGLGRASDARAAAAAGGDEVVDLVLTDQLLEGTRTWEFAQSLLGVTQ